MVRYRRNFIAGGTFFFTVTLADRTSQALVDYVDALRAAMRKTRSSHPFTIDAVAVLPDHLHIVMTLPDAMRTTQTDGASSDADLRTAS
jgi:putative transposase